MRFSISHASIIQLFTGALLLSATTIQALPLGLTKPAITNYMVANVKPDAALASQQQAAAPATATQGQLTTYLNNNNVPQWLGNLDVTGYTQLAEQHFRQHERGMDLVALSAELKHDYAQRLLAKYVEYTLLKRTGLWCGLAVKQGNLAAQSATVSYLLWLTGDYKSSEDFIKVGIQLCQQNAQAQPGPQYAVEIKYSGANTTNTLPDVELVNSVKRYQQRHGIAASGKLDAATVLRLTESPAAIAERIQLNLRRMQAISTPLQGRHIVANIPEFRLALRNGTATVLELNTIVGKRSRPTPELNLQMTRVVINPSWGVPRNLAKLDIIPKVVRDNSYLERKQFSVYNRIDGKQVPVAAETIDWSAMQENFPYYLRQAPGVDNALGQFKFVTPNPQAIYLHDTNSRGLFRHAERAFSSGCLRVQNPGLLAQHIMQGTAYESSDYLNKKLQSGRTRNLNLADELPVYIVYWTTWVDASGQLQQRDDIYQKDSVATEPLMFAQNEVR